MSKALGTNILSPDRPDLLSVVEMLHDSGGLAVRLRRAADGAARLRELWRQGERAARARD